MMAYTSAAYITADDLAAAAADFADSLDRTRLGSFAVPYEALVAVYMEERMWLLEKDRLLCDGLTAVTARSQALIAITAVTGSDDERNVMHNNASAEVLFWWAETESSLWVDWKRQDEGGDWVPSGVVRLREVYNHPDMRSYFENDVWDKGFIRQCISEGVDADMARSLTI